MAVILWLSLYDLEGAGDAIYGLDTTIYGFDKNKGCAGSGVVKEVDFIVLAFNKPERFCSDVHCGGPDLTDERQINRRFYRPSGVRLSRNGLGSSLKNYPCFT